jgi:hypothetical protein
MVRGTRNTFFNLKRDSEVHDETQGGMRIRNKKKAAADFSATALKKKPFYRFKK